MPYQQQKYYQPMNRQQQMNYQGQGNDYQYQNQMRFTPKQEPRQMPMPSGKVSSPTKVGEKSDDLGSWRNNNLF